MENYPMAKEGDEVTEVQAAVAPEAPQVPAGHVVISEAERNRINAENRTLRADAEARTKADDEAEDAARQKLAKDAGDFDTALQVERDRTASVRGELAELTIKDQLRDAITAKGFSGEQASALKGLVNVKAIAVDDNGTPKPGVIEAAVDAIAAQYPAMFKLETDTVDSETETETETETPTRRAVAPASPVNDGERSGDFLSMEEYNATPREVRLTPEFQARAERSKHQWPTKVNANSFPVG